MPLTLRVLAGPAVGSEHRLAAPGTVLIGRSSRCGLMLPSGPMGDLLVSHTHALVEYDLNARNGTRVNDAPATGAGKESETTATGKMKTDLVATTSSMLIPNWVVPNWRWTPGKVSQPVNDHMWPDGPSSAPATRTGPPPSRWPARRRSRTPCTRCGRSCDSGGTGRQPAVPDGGGRAKFVNSAGGGRSAPPVVSGGTGARGYRAADESAKAGRRRRVDKGPPRSMLTPFSRPLAPRAAATGSAQFTRSPGRLPKMRLGGVEKNQSIPDPPTRMSWLPLAVTVVASSFGTPPVPTAMAAVRSL